MATFDQTTPFKLLARLHVKAGCVDKYLELARMTDMAALSSEPGMLHDTFDQDPGALQAFGWSEVCANDEAFAAHVSNPPVQKSLQNMRNLEITSALRLMELSEIEC